MYHNELIKLIMIRKVLIVKGRIPLPTDHIIISVTLPFSHGATLRFWRNSCLI
ncbi:protein of unknown function [Citrobacter amalonaticus]|nr:protein of unknown function [Citrobacter amalonaticus]